METPHNPFILGHRILRPYFCDREEEQQRLERAIVNGRNVVLLARRRMGKTSLAFVALHESEIVKADYLTIFLDILQTNTLKEFTYLLGKTIFDTLRKKSVNILHTFLATLKSLQGTFGFDPFNGTPTFQLQLGDIHHPEYTLEEIFSFLENYGKRVIVIIDEFQQITNYPEKNIEAILRTHIQQLTTTSFIFAGSEQTILQEMFVSAKRPFYNSAEIMHLGPIPKEIYTNFAVKMFQDYGRDIELECIEKIYDLFDGNTFYLQRSMNIAFSDTSVGEVCHQDKIKWAVKSMIASDEVIYREILSSISRSHKSTLYAIAQSKIAIRPTSSDFMRRHSLSSASTVQNALQKLSKSGIITRTPKGYALTDPLMRIFINDLYFTPEI